MSLKIGVSKTGLCLCGCGKKTSISKKNRPERGNVKGFPIAYFKNHRLVTKKEKNCPECGKSFWVVPSDLKNNRGKTCSQSCSNKHRWNDPNFLKRYANPKRRDRVYISNTMRMIKLMPNGCWQWTGYVHPSGYVFRSTGKRSIPAHREFYRIYRGTIKENLTVDHLCRNRICMNPCHLEAVSQVENNRRGKMARDNPKSYLDFLKQKGLGNIWNPE